MIWIRLFYISFAVIISFVSTNGNNLNKLPCEYHDSINITNGYHNGSKIIFDGITFGPDQYATVQNALDRQSKLVPVKSHVRGCICNIKTCIRTCCPHGHVRVYKDGTADCVQNDQMNNFHFPIRMRNENDENETISAKDRFTIVHSNPPGCEKMIQIHNYAILHTGEAIVGKTKINHSRYCINYDFDAPTNTTTDNLLFCEIPRKEHQSTFDHFIIPVCLMISIPFLIATILVYRFIPELYNLHGKCLLYYLASFTIAFLITAIIKWNSSLSLFTCHLSGWIMYFSYIVAFLWLSVICYDLWSNIRNTKGWQKYSDGRLFIYYFAYAMGLAITFTIISMILNYTDLVTESWRPEIGNEMCFIKKKFARGLYFYGPLAILLGISFVYFILTAILIRQLQRVSSPEITTETHVRNLKTNGEKCILYLQLFVVMGIPWTMEVLSFFFVSLSDTKISKFFEIVNALQGVLVFALLVLRPRTLELIKKRWKQYRGTSEVNTMSDPKESNPLSMTQVE